MARASQTSIKAKSADARGAVIDALMALAAEQDFNSISISDVCRRSGVGIADMRDLFPSKGAILAGFSRRIDRLVLESVNDDLADESDKERLFDILMRRLDAMAPYKDALRAIAQWAKRDPISAAALNNMLLNSMRFMLEAAGVRNEGALSHMKLQGLALLWARVFSVWLKDDEEGWPATMAELDRGLARGQTILARVGDVGRAIAPFRSAARSAAASVGRKARRRAAKKFMEKDEAEIRSES